jgi:hypothetical protein
MKRHKWADIKTRTSAETRARIEAESKELANELRRSERLPPDGKPATSWSKSRRALNEAIDRRTTLLAV